MKMENARCPHCGKSLLTYQQQGWFGGFIELGECRNPGCDAYMITLEVEELLALTTEQVASCAKARARGMKVVNNGR